MHTSSPVATEDGFERTAEEDAWLTPTFVLLTIALGLAAFIVVPSLLEVVARGKQRRTMSDLRSIGVAIESYQVDHGYVPCVVGAGLEIESLEPLLVPTFIKALPHRDGWGRPLGWWHGTADDASYSLSSTGKDGVREGMLPPGGATTDFNRDIYFSNGQFSIFPESRCDGG
jgi:type II secretory pathway pseudopilin PulG